jgi:hypothetical protein
MVGVRMAVLIVRFVIEIAMLVGLAAAGARLGQGITSWVLGIALPVAALAAWGQWVAPKARRPVSLGVRVAIELVLFGGTTVLLASAELPGWAVAFGVVSVAVSLATAATQGVRTPFDEQPRAR